MLSKEESKKIRQEFWTSFGKEYPHKWLLYNTKMKEIQLKFTFNRKFAQVSLDVIDEDELIRAYYFEKLRSLEKILKAEYLPEIIFDEEYELPEEKVIGRIYLQLDNVSIHNPKTWPEVKEFLNAKMLQLEEFFKDFSDFLKN
ncbi:DUF4268 domain-containing protein [Christiangramia sp. SM2212]|uniref:DUF4268 domain-containing protein n=1 Tax=Christiangramia sediminicola TaxID=3073267 RepID=A0ABU1EUG3_9FLAO|nr:DUF4268 domain-containing protein [Christiangramia sp. SM2212]MDR5592040.1 DUF4268 domain-containing protein [Christiangramia sp. SM2212]